MIRKLSVVLVQNRPYGRRNHSASGWGCCKQQSRAKMLIWSEWLQFGLSWYYAQTWRVTSFVFIEITMLNNASLTLPKPLPYFCTRSSVYWNSNSMSYIDLVSRAWPLMHVITRDRLNGQQRTRRWLSRDGGVIDRTRREDHPLSHQKRRLITNLQQCEDTFERWRAPTRRRYHYACKMMPTPAEEATSSEGLLQSTGFTYLSSGCCPDRQIPTSLYTYDCDGMLIRQAPMNMAQQKYISWHNALHTIYLPLLNLSRASKRKTNRKYIETSFLLAEFGKQHAHGSEKLQLMHPVRIPNVAYTYASTFYR